MAKKEYKKRTDLEKLKSQWKKVFALHGKDQWSAAIVRAVTAAEIAANFAIRTVLSGQHSLDPEFVNSLLKRANGLHNKMNDLLLPLSKTDPAKADKVSTLWSGARHIAEKRNLIVHSGEFSKKKEAKATIATTKKFIVSLVRLYEPGFKLPQRDA